MSAFANFALFVDMTLLKNILISRRLTVGVPQLLVQLIRLPPSIARVQFCSSSWYRPGKQIWCKWHPSVNFQDFMFEYEVNSICWLNPAFDSFTRRPNLFVADKFQASRKCGASIVLGIWVIDLFPYPRWDWLVHGITLLLVMQCNLLWW